ncbi:MAG: protein kinase [Acidobacteria bacterium]|nr:protein kinase [Acidobacteriota bacterium]
MNLAALFQAVADLPLAERNAYYRQHAVPDALRAEVESLIEFDSHATTFLLDGVANAASGIVDSMERPERCGPFHPVKLLGRGGMGSVWLAERTDGQVDQQVAVKVLRAGAPTPRQQERFIQERRILATLSHPNIARLLDAGQTDAGQPFLAMEYVEGLPIDHFCRQLDHRKTLRIFLKVCTAVAYAHRNLIIHRDLKPSNILVNTEGEPKLLDFGIAKLINFAGDRTTTIERVLTPDYASPEQVNGRNTGTATDIYSLGAILYKLLTGHTPHQFADTHPAAMSAVICERPVTPPSQHDKSLEGDLDSILLKALRKEPEERYASVEKLAEDIENHLEFRPVKARSGNVLYLSRRFLRRHWLAVTGPAVAMAGLAAGLIVAQQQRAEAESARAIAESRRVEAQQQRDNATHERTIAVRQEAEARQQREEAQKQRAIAEQRYQQVRQIALHLLDLDREMLRLSGATKARQALVTTSLSYLEKLGAESGDDERFRLELAEAYRKVAQVQSNPGTPNLGQPKEALQSLAKAEKILATLPLNYPSAAIARLDNIDLQARIYGSGQDWETTLATSQKGLRLAGNSRLDTLEMLERKAALTYTAQAALVNLDRMAEALRYGQLSADYRKEIYRQRGTSASATNLANTLLGLAATMRSAGDLGQAEQRAAEGRQVIEQQYEKGPSPTTGRRLVWALYQEARVLGSRESISLARWDDAAALLERSLTLARQLIKADAEDIATRNNLAAMVAELAALRLDSNPDSALALFEEANRVRGSLPAANPNHQEKFHMQAGAVRALARLRRFDEAATRLERLFQALKESKLYPGHLGPGSFAASALRAQADLSEAQGNRAAAIRSWEELAAGYESSPRRADNDLQWAIAHSEVFRSLARLYEAAGNRSAANLSQQKDRAIWDQWSRKLPSSSFVERQLRASR